jgi:hypothetical protein
LGVATLDFALESSVRTIRVNALSSGETSVFVEKGQDWRTQLACFAATSTDL